jgi:REP element-mobilizing transposase RayT
MAGTYAKLIYHTIFSTKNRDPLDTPGLRENLYPYIGGILRGQEGALEAIGGMTDHIHLAVRIKPDISLSEIVRLIKANSSKWINEQPNSAGRFELAMQAPAFQAGFRPVLQGLVAASRGTTPARFDTDSDTGRQFLGWGKSRHWLLG